MGQPVIVIFTGTGHGALQVAKGLFQCRIAIGQGHYGGPQAGVAVAQVIEQLFGGGRGGAGQQQGQMGVIVAGRHIAAANALGYPVSK